MKHYTLLFLLACLTACQSKTNNNKEPIQQVQAKPAADQLIIPGKSIGQIALNDSFEAVQERLGKPDFNDAAMGSALFTWYANHNTTSFQTSIFGSRNASGENENVLQIKNILVTSPHFITADSIQTGIDLGTIQKHYSLQKKGQYKTQQNTVNIYADTRKGIAFEINEINSMCVGIMVFKPGDEPSTYINMHEH